MGLDMHIFLTPSSSKTIDVYLHSRFAGDPANDGGKGGDVRWVFSNPWREAEAALSAGLTPDEMVEGQFRKVYGAELSHSHLVSTECFKLAER